MRRARRLCCACRAKVCHWERPNFGTELSQKRITSGSAEKTLTSVTRSIRVTCEFVFSNGMAIAVEPGITAMRSTGKSPLLVLVTLVTATITLCAQVGPQETASGQTQERLAKATREAMINVLGSADANPSMGEEAKTFD